jgi:hypothetical protein
MATQVRAFLTKTFANRVDAEHLQETLRALGYHPGPVDGRFGLGTERAVVAFQNDKGLTPNGFADPETWKALDKALHPTAKKKAKPEAESEPEVAPVKAPAAKKAPAKKPAAKKPAAKKPSVTT